MQHRPPVQSPFINVLNNYHCCGNGVEVFSVQFVASTKYCATECLLSVITAAFQLTSTFDFRFARRDSAEHSQVMLTGCKRLSVSRMGCAFFTSPPLAKDVLCSVWVQ